MNLNLVGLLQEFRRVKGMGILNIVLLLKNRKWSKKIYKPAMHSLELIPAEYNAEGIPSERV